MKNAQAAAGPGRPVQERRDAATHREELEELPGDSPGSSTPGIPPDPASAARQGERDAHVATRGTDANSPSRPG